jgi:hypothetical protein
MKMFGTVFFICTCGFFLWIMLATTPLERINRACEPTRWIGKTATTTGSLVDNKTEHQVAGGARTLFDTCRYFVFRQFYAEELARMRAQAEAAAAAKGAK